LKIFHLIGHLRLGAGRYIVELAKEQKRSFAHDVEVIVSDDIDDSWRSDKKQITELENAGIGVTTIGNIFKRDRESLRESASRLAPMLAAAGEDHVAHAHSAVPAAVAKMARARRLVATCHGWNPNRPQSYNIEDTEAFRQCAAIISPSRHWAARLESDLGVKGAIVIPVGVRMENFPHMDRKERAAGPAKILTVCELTHRKGVDLLIKAMPMIWKNFEKTELHIFGDGDITGELKNLAGRLDDSGALITFHGFVAGPYRRLADYDLFCLASRSDNYPVSIIEAMLDGLPVVGTDVGGIPEMIEDGGCGEVAETESPGAVASKIARLLNGGHENMRELGQSGERFARSRLDIKITAEAIGKVYRGVIPAAL